MTFRVGQKVVCVAQCRAKLPCEVMPRMGQIYTIRSICDYDDGIPGLLFAEIRNPELHYADGFGECDFNALKFRPVVERETDISVFHEILRTTKAPETVAVCSHEEKPHG
ncbi:hypothetical protein [Tardiphaga sp. 709]|uniref:hypothetical protein n=1 Tax=Tardiphaga sp. 709 TaxID=3076039 RepID=UPI0028E26B64|nr:hypothetical protein [Tardiphaga sp. 709]WNV09994.1 hypothetical protein RSO67_01995 [Tardiphaga sp. 709]